MRAPRISVVTVCLNDLSGLLATHESLYVQTQRPHEWLVADGGSTDGTIDWLRQNDWALLRWTSECDGGIYRGMNRALRLVTGDYVLFLNSGDVLSDPDVISDVTTSIAMCAQSPSLVYGDCLDVEVGGQIWHRRARQPRWSPIGMPACHQAMIFRVDSLGAGFDERYRLSADYGTVLNLFSRHRGSDFCRLHRTVCRFQLGGRSSQQRIAGMREDLRVRREILGMGPIPGNILYLLHHAHFWVKEHVPFLHRLFRYN